jgi:hypothetical protein
MLRGVATRITAGAAEAADATRADQRGGLGSRGSLGDGVTAKIRGD